MGSSSDYNQRRLAGALRQSSLSQTLTWFSPNYSQAFPRKGIIMQQCVRAPVVIDMHHGGLPQRCRAESTWPSWQNLFMRGLWQRPSAEHKKGVCDARGCKSVRRVLSHTREARDAAAVQRWRRRRRQNTKLLEHMAENQRVASTEFRI